MKHLTLLERCTLAHLPYAGTHSPRRLEPLQTLLGVLPRAAKVQVRRVPDRHHPRLEEPPQQREVTLQKQTASVSDTVSTLFRLHQGSRYLLLACLLLELYR